MSKVIIYNELERYIMKEAENQYEDYTSSVIEDIDELNKNLKYKYRSDYNKWSSIISNLKSDIITIIDSSNSDSKSINRLDIIILLKRINKNLVLLGDIYEKITKQHKYSLSLKWMT